MIFFCLLQLVNVPIAAAEEWDFLEINFAQSRTTGIGSILLSDDKKLASFIVLDGHLPRGKDLALGRIVGSRTRLVMHFCGTDTADIAHTKILDLKRELFVDQEHTPTIKVRLSSDEPLRRAALYACGDQSQKIGDTSSSGASDLIVLTCSYDSDKTKNITFKISESNSTVNGIPASFSSELIEIKTPASGGGFIKTRINRYSGRMEAWLDTKRIISGTCMKHEKQLF